jgi:hypothetical protein
VYARISGVDIPDLHPEFTARWEARELTEVETLQIGEVFTRSNAPRSVGGCSTVERSTTLASGHLQGQRCVTITEEFYQLPAFRGVEIRHRRPPS